ncbi:Dabb family protein [Rubrobacter indicoceani]|uniref:Dabb family protein n=1 Tax=Rubrobacter indicoceani TaxID=2051957 RepID=UPI000E5B059F|nr:Dabb family protein [Rubrobacter indicoceani]
MVDHLVFFDVKSGVPADEREDLLASLGALKEKVPGVLDLTVGEDFSGRSGDYTHALFARFEDREGLKTYATHEAHLEVVEKLDRLSNGRIVCDYEH